MAMTNPSKIDLSCVPAFVNHLRSLSDRVEGIYNSDTSVEDKQAQISQLVGDVS